MAVPVVCRSGAGRRRADGSRSDAVMSRVERSNMAISTRMTLTESHQLEARRAPVTRLSRSIMTPEEVCRAGV